MSWSLDSSLTILFITGVLPHIVMSSDLQTSNYSGSGDDIMSTVSSSSMTVATQTPIFSPARKSPEQGDDDFPLDRDLTYTIIGIGAAVIVLSAILFLLCCCLCCTRGHKKGKKKVTFTDPEEGGVELVGVKITEIEDGEQTQTGDSSEVKGDEVDDAEKPVESSERRGSDEKITLLTFGHQEGGEGSDMESGAKKEGEETKKEGEDGGKKEEAKGDDNALAKEDRKSDSDVPGGDSAGKKEPTVSDKDIATQDGKGSVDKEDKDNLGAKDTDVQGNTTLSSPESKQTTDASMSVEGVRQTQVQDSKSKVTVEGDAKEPPEAVPPPQQLEGVKVEPSGASSESTQDNGKKEDDKTSSSQATAMSDNTPSTNEKTSEVFPKTDGAETVKTEPLSLADIEKSLGLALEELGQF